MNQSFEKKNKSKVSKYLLISMVFILSILCIDLIFTRYHYARELITINRNGDDKELIMATYQKISKRYNMDLANVLRYSNLLSKNQRYDDAKSYYRKYLTNQYSPDVVFRLGHTYFINQQYDSAKIYFESLHYLSPSKFRPLYYMARSYRASGDTLRADSIAQLIINKEPKINSPEVIMMKEAMKSIISK